MFLCKSTEIQSFRQLLHFCRFCFCMGFPNTLSKFEKSARMKKTATTQNWTKQALNEQKTRKSRDFRQLWHFYRFCWGMGFPSTLSNFQKTARMKKTATTPKLDSTSPHLGHPGPPLTTARRQSHRPPEQPPCYKPPSI